MNPLPEVERRQIAIAATTSALEDRKLNKAHKFGETDAYTFVAVVLPNGNEVPGHLTDAAIKEIIQRGKRNLEDAPGKETWFEMIKRWFGC